jgi:hypothetical protein
VCPRHQSPAHISAAEQQGSIAPSHNRSVLCPMLQLAALSLVLLMLEADQTACVAHGMASQHSSMVQSQLLLLTMTVDLCRQAGRVLGTAGSCQVRDLPLAAIRPLSQYTAFQRYLCSSKASTQCIQLTRLFGGYELTVTRTYVAQHRNLPF